MIFTNLVEMIETTVSYEMADEILQEANLSSDGIFTSVGHYPLEDVVEIVTLPTFSILNEGPGMIQMLYQSPRQLETLASGLIQGGAEYFNTTVDVDMVIVQTAPYKVQITVKQA